MSERISLQTLNGKRLSGSFDLQHGIVTVTASNERRTQADVAASILSAETLAKTLLLHLHKEMRPSPYRAKGREQEIS